jgi:hypothetical protein
VADTFVDLQDKRHIADYDNSEVWGWSQVNDIVYDAHDAFDQLAAIRTHPAASEYLLSLLIGNKRE